jgi:hypothetical protein
MATPKNTLKEWFKNGKKPTQEQFWAWMDSYFHRDEKIPVETIEGINQILINKADREVVEHILKIINNFQPGAEIDDSANSGSDKTYSINKINQIINDVWNAFYESLEWQDEQW